MPKLSQHMVEGIFKDAGCELLDTYQDARTKVTYRCSCGRIDMITLDSFQHGHRCIDCQQPKPHLSQDFVEKYFKMRGCILLEPYTHSKTKMKFRCSCGNTARISWDSFKAGTKCEMCGRERAGRKLSGPNHPNWNPDRNAVALLKKIKERTYTMLHRCLEQLQTNVSEHSFEVLGYTSQELQAHLACFPNFEQLQRGDWHLDHIFPIKAFVEHGITELGFINALDNLQPLSKEANCGKNDAYDEDAFISYCIRHGLNVQRRKVQ